MSPKADWFPPLSGLFVPSSDERTYLVDDDINRLPIRPYHTVIPIAPHPGAFGVKRKHHTHEGVDLYVPDGTSVYAVEDGIVVAITPFTGASEGSPWWEETQAVLIEGETGVVVYGEIRPWITQPGAHVKRGDIVGFVKRVLKTDKGRPMSMLHLELHTHGAQFALAWEESRPETLLDPTPHLLRLISGCKVVTDLDKLLEDAARDTDK
jgi:murein DD-endopeptidase MepM/ murein hydrolase activator NlpD